LYLVRDASEAATRPPRIDTIMRSPLPSGDRPQGEKTRKTMATKHESTHERKLQDDVKDTAHRIWLAGLGALAAAEEEGTKLFSRLVDRGRDVEERGKIEVDKVVDKANKVVDKVVDKAKSKAGGSWEDLGSKVDETITSALHRLGVPTREEIRNLTKRVEELNAKVELLRPRVTHAPEQKATAPKSSAGKSASKVV
jgi:poly(hydroxyalkanoate) granule-associated protein